ncbi:glycosyltransferase family 2 protein [uncultured Roseovarius sp.]|uniref:glycosyltransferase family 2 protein n=1 Tax=uncultured Roseovarius sp. TaxID=293344 RepID=UPI0025E23876|nr:glycosyltransferase family 2 protein [uncultured Roseovarius sp.]
MSTPTWGLVATIKANSTDILSFAAHHLDLGAHRVHIYLDEDAPEAREALIGHPKCRVILCDDGYWKRRAKRKGRPAKHQPRQTMNATHCYNRNPQVDWLVHLDVDEFLWPATPLPDQLATLPDGTLSARVRPIEALASDPTDPPPEGQIWAKGCADRLKHRRAQTNAIYPTYGDHLNGGFLSHVAGKVFVRTGHDGITLRIHNAFRNGEQDDNAAPLPKTHLVHLHGHDWDHWLKHYRFRLAQGSYRDSLKPAPMADGVALTMNQLFTLLEDESGEEALRTFYTEVCTATPDLRKRLAEHGHLHAITLDLAAKRARHFPHIA